jgi:hypothetical protein
MKLAKINSNKPLFAKANNIIRKWLAKHNLENKPKTKHEHWWTHRKGKENQDITTIKWDVVHVNLQYKQLDDALIELVTELRPLFEEAGFIFTEEFYGHEDDGDHEHWIYLTSHQGSSERLLIVSKQTQGLGLEHPNINIQLSMER